MYPAASLGMLTDVGYIDVQVDPGLGIMSISIVGDNGNLRTVVLEPEEALKVAQRLRDQVHRATDPDAQISLRAELVAALGRDPLAD